MRRLSVLALALTAALLVGSQAVSAKVGKGKVVASATGAGHMTLNDAKRTFAFSAREFADGTDKGQAQLRERGAAGFRVHVRVTCLNVVGNVAHMTGFVSRIKTETPPLRVRNSKVAFSVQDNGKTGDRVSPMTFHGDVPAVSCAAPLALTLLVERGQVKVRP